jgi:hypothetical protein
LNEEDERYFRSLRPRKKERTEDEIMALFCPHFNLVPPEGFRAEGYLVCQRKKVVCDLWTLREGRGFCSLLLPEMLSGNQRNNGKDGLK